MKNMKIKPMIKAAFILSTFFISNVNASDSSNCNTANGDVIIDNTATSSVVAIGTNLGFRCDSKSSTAIDDGIGGNAINIIDFEVLVRDITQTPNALTVYVGKSAETVSDFNYGTANQFDYFADGLHLFDLDRLRVAANWLTKTVMPSTSVPAQSYGTISLQQFLANIANNVTMYGIVRVLVPLEAGQSASTLNALGTTVAANTLYGFCNSTTALCACAPGSNASFTNIEPSVTICNQTMPANAKIKVKGSLFWDFIDSVDGHSLGLAELPYIPRELYFKVVMPIMVNWAHDIDDDGAMDNMVLVKNYSDGYANGSIVNAVYAFADLPTESKDQYRFDTGVTLTATLFDALADPDKYHMMLPSGYADGWATAFSKLNITAKQWSSIPGMTKPFRVPAGVTGVMVADDVRTEGFEDIPTYLYSGGLIDMHDHVNVSGLVYVPQGMELEAKTADVTKQYVSGAIIIRDSFYIEAKTGTITIISSDPSSYSTVRVRAAGGSSGLSLTYNKSSYQLAHDEESKNSGTNGTTTTTSSQTTTGSSGNSGTPGSVNWQEIRPQF